MITPTIVRRPHALVALAAAAALASTAVAGGAGSATLTIMPVGAEPGTTVAVPVRLATDDLVGAFDFAVDSSKLVVSDVAYDGLLFSNGWQGWDTTPAVNAHVNAACIFPQDQITGSNLHLLHLMIDVPADAAPSSAIPIGMSSATVSNYSFVPYDLTIIEGTIFVTTGLCNEDIDANGAVGFSDILAVVAAWGPCTGPCAADVNTDASVGLADLLMVLGAWGECD